MSDKNSAQASGATVEDAIQAAVAQLGVTRTDVTIDVIEQGSPGVLGIGKKEAVVRVSLLGGSAPAPVAEPEVAAEPVAESEPEEVAAPAPKKAKKPPKKKQPAVAKAESGSDSAETEQEHPTLEQEAEVAQEIVSNLLELMEIPAEVNVEITDADDLGERIPLVRIVGDDLSMLIGHRGKVLGDLQFLARSMASQQLEGRTTFAIDVDGYREKRTSNLVDLAQRTAEKAIKFGRPIALNPMPPHERRVIHMALRTDERVTTSSKGEGKRRRVRVAPKR